MITVSKLFGTTALTAAVFAGVVPAVAQNQGGEASFSLEEITVTAQKRAESIQDVAIAISAFNGNDLDKINAVDVTDVVSRTPNFNMTQFNLGEPQFTIRGVGSSSDSAASDPTVPVFVDEVYNARPGSGAFDFFDLERVEVLRGPQGTLYGRNTSGGAVNIITKKPSQEAYSKVFLSYGNYDSMQAKAVFNGGLTETVAAKLSLAYRKHDGYSENILTGDELMDAENFSARLQFMFEPSDTTSLLISTDYSKDDNGGNARVPFPSLAPLDAFIKLQFPDGTSIRKSYANPDSFQKRDMGGIMAKYEQEMDWATLTSISAYRETDYSWFEDLGGLEFGNPEKPWVLKNDDYADEKASQFSQELRLSSKPEEMVKWVAGLYYFTESVDRTERFVTEAAVIFPPVLGGDVSFLQDVKTHSYAAFAETTYPISENFQITGGLRYTHDKKSVNQVTTDNDGSDPVPGLPLLAAPFDVSASDSWDALTGKISLEYKSDNVLYYGTVSRGYKSGMFPSQPNDPVVAVTAQPPERLWNYEIGIKSDLMDKRVRLNVAAFLMDYSNLQLFQLTPELRLQTFSGTAKNYGAEVELAAAVTPELEIGANGSYLHTNLKETSIGMFAGSDLSVSPTWSYNLYVDWSRQLDGGEISVRADYQWRDEYNRGFTPEGGQPPAESNIPSLGLLDARIAYAFKENQYEVALWGKNLTNKDYQTHVIPFVGSGFSLFGPPRTYGVSFTAHF
ncbi:TonB-dependent receptor [Kordiimonas sediminis]|uniref:TonB-dependent receptor n=1 Tax=Kordiimonas sediminis TaxID=1735581 RepID=A0A919ANT3_9PROT|nr:TonB-dependent receptor [Kordiimonas sediminis]GHF17547.1 TonB-dependent receptor [Kordiimonas sediminis]